jgi:apolipoprotein N-acyltransferase
MENNLENRIKNTHILGKIALYALFGALWSFAQVGYSFALLTWFTFIPYLYMIKYENYKDGVIYSLIFGFTAYMVHFWWMPLSLAPVLFMNSNSFIFKALSLIISWLINIGICSYHGLMYVAGFLIARYIAKRNIRLFYFYVPVVFTVLDVFFPKLWYDQIGYSQYIFFHFSQIADLLGVPLITFIVFSSNSACIILIEAYLYKKNIKRSALLFLTVICVIILSSIYGILRCNYIKNLYNDSPESIIGVVQGNYSGIDKLDETRSDEMINAYNELSISLIDQKPVLIVWPETAVTKIYDVKVKNYDGIKKFSGSSLLTGINLIDYKDNGDYDVYNSLVLISSNKKYVDSYSKIKLLPFAERMPLGLNSILNFLGYKEFSSGKENKILKINNFKIVPNICYEAIIPDFVRKSLNIKGEESNIIINVTNDSWYGNTIEPKMHLMLARFRAIENRKTLIRATCTGYSAIILPTGDIIYQSELFKKDYIARQVPLLEDVTFYRKWGWFFKWLLMLFLLGTLITVSYRKIKFKNDKAKIISRRVYENNLRKLWYE